jgi:hypothetical protein
MGACKKISRREPDKNVFFSRRILETLYPSGSKIFNWKQSFHSRDTSRRYLFQSDNN